MSWLAVYTTVEWLIRLGMVLAVLRRRMQPATALAWLTLVFFWPLLGGAVYMLVGDNRLGRRRRTQHRQIHESLRGLLHNRSVVKPDIEPGDFEVVQQAENVGGMPILGGNQVELLDDADEVIARLVADIDKAEHHVHLLFYIYQPDETGWRVAEALARAAARGVACRLIADHAGSYTFFEVSDLARWLQQQGVWVYPALPVSPLRVGLARIDLRNHRKLVVVDGRVAYTGSQNIVNPGFGSPRAGAWVDLSGRYEGPVVSQLQLVFLEDWVYETGEELSGGSILPDLRPAGTMAAQAIPTLPGPDVEAFPKVLLTAIAHAQRKIVITSPYFVPDEPMILALQMAAERGVEVHIIVPGKNDYPIVTWAAHSHFEPLLESGVRIYQYKPGMLHAKTLTVDDAFALLGSSNVDIRSFYLNLELNVLMYGPQITQQLRFAQYKYIAEAEEVRLEDWRRRHWTRRYVEGVAGLFTPLL